MLVWFVLLTDRNSTGECDVLICQGSCALRRGFVTKLFLTFAGNSI